MEINEKPQVNESTKTAETRAADQASDESIYFAIMIKEIYTGFNSLNQIPVVIYPDSKSTLDSINSTRQVERKNYLKLHPIYEGYLTLRSKQT